MQRVLAVLAAVAIGAALFAGGGRAASDYVDTEPAPVGTAVQLEPGRVTVAVTMVTVGDDPNEVIAGLADTVQPGDAGIAVELTITSDEAEAFRPRQAIDSRLVDVSGQEHDGPRGLSHCGNPDNLMLTYGNIRPGRSATVTLCWVVPGDQIDGAFLELSWRDGGLFLWRSNRSPRRSLRRCPTKHTGCNAALNTRDAAREQRQRGRSIDQPRFAWGRTALLASVSFDR